MGNASLLDVFNAATHVGNQALDIYSREKKYELDIKLYNEAADFQRVQDKLIADLNTPDADGNMAFLQNPGAYAGHVNKTIGEWVNKAAKAGNNSRYYNDRLHELETQGRLAMNKRVVAATVKALNQQAQITTGKQLTNIRNDERLTPEQKLEEGLATVRLAGQNNVYDAVEQYKIESDLVDDNWKQAGTYQDNGEDRVKQAKESIKTNLSSFEEKTFERTGIHVDDYIQDKQANIHNFEQTAIKVVYDRNITNMRTDDEAYSQSLADYKNGNHAGYSGASEHLMKLRSWFTQGRTLVNEGVYGTDNTEYDPADYDDLLRMYKWDEVLGRDLSGGPKKDGAKQFPDQYIKDAYYTGVVLPALNGTLIGRDGHKMTMAEVESNTADVGWALWNEFIRRAETDLTAAEGVNYHRQHDLSDLSDIDPRKGYVNFMDNEAQGNLRNSQEHYNRAYNQNESAAAQMFVEAGGNTIKAIVKNYNLSKFTSLEAANKITTLQNYVLDMMKEGPLTEARLQQFAIAATRIMTDKNIPGFNKNANPRNKRNAESSLIALIENEGIYTLGTDPNASFINDDHRQLYENEGLKLQRAVMSQATGIPEDQLTFLGYAPQKGMTRDVSGAMVFQGIDSNGNSMQYTFGISGEGRNKTIHVETRSSNADRFRSNFSLDPWSNTGRTPTPQSDAEMQRAVNIAGVKVGWEPNPEKLPPNTRQEDWNGDRVTGLARIERLARSGNKADFPTVQGGEYAKIKIGETQYSWDAPETFSEAGLRAKELYLLQTYGVGW
jgi:hypothetical protein